MTDDLDNGSGTEGTEMVETQLMSGGSILLDRSKDFHQDENFFTKFDIDRTRPLSCGMFGILYKTLIHRTRETAIAKYVPMKKKMTKTVVFNELKILKTIGKHPCIVCLLGSHEENSSRMWLILEECNKGDLQSYCEDTIPTAEQIVLIVKQCATALDFLHSQPTAIIHRNVRPDNILLHQIGDELQTKLSGFEHSKLGDECAKIDTLFLTCNVGMNLYTAPEIWAHIAYSGAIDIFSLGLTLEALVHLHQNVISALYPATANRPLVEHMRPIGLVMHETNKSYNLVKTVGGECRNAALCKELANDMCKYEFTNRPSAAFVIEYLDIFLDENWVLPQKESFSIRPTNSSIEKSGYVTMGRIDNNLGDTSSPSARKIQFKVKKSDDDIKGSYENWVLPQQESVSIRPTNSSIEKSGYMTMGRSDDNLEDASSPSARRMKFKVKKSDIKDPYENVVLSQKKSGPFRRTQSSDATSSYVTMARVDEYLEDESEVLSQKTSGPFRRTQSSDATSSYETMARVEENLEVPVFNQTVPLAITQEQAFSLDGSWKAFCCWRTSYEDVIAIGAFYPPSVIIAYKESITTHKLQLGKSVFSGTGVDIDVSIILTRNPTSVYTIKLDPTERQSQLLEPLYTLAVDNPVSLFQMNDCRHIGILCRDVTRLEIYNVTDILSRNPTEPIKTVDMFYPDPHDYDTATCSPEGYLYIASYLGHTVHVYTLEGTAVKSIGTPSSPTAVSRGMLYKPQSIQCAADGSVVVTGQRGDINVYHRDRWELVKGKGYDTNCGVCTKYNFWVVDFRIRVFRITKRGALYYM